MDADAYLDHFEAHLYILREAFACVKPQAMLRSIGKESIELLWPARTAFFGKVLRPR